MRNETENTKRLWSGLFIGGVQKENEQRVEEIQGLTETETITKLVLINNLMNITKDRHFSLSFLLCEFIIFISSQVTIFIGHKIMEKFFYAVSVALVTIGVIMFSQFFVVFGLFCFNIVPI